MAEHMVPTQAVGIDLGTTYSVIAHLNESGEPVTLPNQEGELSTPSVVLFDGDQPIVGTEALRTRSGTRTRGRKRQAPTWATWGGAGGSMTGLTARLTFPR